MEYAVVIERAADGSYSAYVPDLPGCTACGDTEAEVQHAIVEAIDLHIESLKYHHEPVPPPTTRVVTVATEKDEREPKRSQKRQKQRQSKSDSGYMLAPAELADADAFAARVHGDSMVPAYREGDIVIFSPSAEIRDGDDCFVRFQDGQTTFKQIFRGKNSSGQSVVELRPRNDKYRPQVVPSASIEAMWRASFKYTSVSEPASGTDYDEPMQRIHEPRRIPTMGTVN